MIKQSISIQTPHQHDYISSIDRSTHFKFNLLSYVTSWRTRKRENPTVVVTL